MAMDGLRGYLLLASGLADMSRAKATEAASALLSLSSGLTGGRSSSNVQLQVQDLAEELLAAAAANRRSLIALVRSEVERAVARSPIPPDELDRARAAVAKLSADVEALQAQILTNPAVGEVAAKLGLAGHAVSRPADDGVVVDAAFTSPVDEPVPAAPRRRPPRKQIADRASTRPVATDAGDNGAERPTESAASTEPAVTTTTAAPAKKAATKRAAPAKKAATKKAARKAAHNGGADHDGASQEGRHQEGRHQEDRHQEGRHQEGRHQEGRHQEERCDHHGQAGQEGGEDHDHSGAPVRRGDHEEGGRDEVLQNPPPRSPPPRSPPRRPLRGAAHDGRYRRVGGVAAAVRSPHHGRGGTPHRRRPGRRGAGAAPRQCRVGVPRRAGRGRRGGAPSVAGPAGRPRR